MSNSELLKNTLGSDAYWVVNKKIAREVGFTAAVLLADLISKRGYFEKRGELQPDGSFFNFSDAIESDLQIGKEARIAAQKALQARGFLKIYRRGIPPKNFFLIQDDEIIRALNSHTSINIDDHSSTNTTYVPLETATKNKNKQTRINNTILSSREASKVSSSLKKEMKIVSPAEAKGDQRKDDKIHIPSDKDIKLSPDSAVKSVAQPKLPDYAVKASNWYQHYLKSPINEEVFKSLPTEIQSSLYAKTLQLVSGVRMSNGRISDATDAKDQFVSALEAYRQKNNPDKVTSEDDFTFEF